MLSNLGQNGDGSGEERFTKGNEGMEYTLHSVYFHDSSEELRKRSTRCEQKMTSRLVYRKVKKPDWELKAFFRVA